MELKEAILSKKPFRVVGGSKWDWLIAEGNFIKWVSYQYDDVTFSPTELTTDCWEIKDEDEH